MKEAVTLLLLDSYDDVEWRTPDVLAVKRLKSKGEQRVRYEKTQSIHPRRTHPCPPRARRKR
jgi:hypothetical protein